MTQRTLSNGHKSSSSSNKQKRMASFGMLSWLLVLLWQEGRFVSTAYVISTRPWDTQRRAKQSSFHRSVKTTTTTDTEAIDFQAPRLHVIEGIEFREIPIALPVVGTVTILEATLAAQEELVDMALLEDDDDVGIDESIISEGDPYGAVLWPAAWAVANYLVTLESTTTTLTPLDGISILELGAGTGLVSITAALAGASVTASDYEPLALTLTRYAGQQFHNLTIETRPLDLCDSTAPLPYADIVVAADVMYEPKTGKALALRVIEALQQNSRVIVGDSPGRAGRPAFLHALKELGLETARFQDTVGRTCSGPRHDLICGKNSASVSETPKEISIAIMDLRPDILKSQFNTKL